MARLLMVKKTVDTHKTKGDIVDYYDDGKFFPSNIFDSFDVMDMPPFTKEELSAILEGIAFEKKLVFRSNTTDWTDTRPTEKETWKNRNDEWCFFEERGDTQFTLREMTSVNRTTLEDPEVDAAIKTAILTTVVKETVELLVENADKIDNLVS